MRKHTKHTRSFSGARIALLLCCALLGGILGFSGTEYALSAGGAPETRISAAPSVRLPPAAPAEHRMDINRAASEDLLFTPEYTWFPAQAMVRPRGPALARAILDAREQAGGFLYIEELKDVPGIGESRLQALKELFFCPVP